MAAKRDFKIITRALSNLSSASGLLQRSCAVEFNAYDGGEFGAWSVRFCKEILLALGRVSNRHEWQDLLRETASQCFRKGFRISAEILRQNS